MAPQIAANSLIWMKALRPPSPHRQCRQRPRARLDSRSRSSRPHRLRRPHTPRSIHKDKDLVISGHSVRAMWIVVVVVIVFRFNVDDTSSGAHERRWVLSRPAGCVDSDVPHSSCSLIWSLGRWMKHHARIKQLNEAETALQHEETAHKRNHLSEKMKRCLYTPLSYPHSDLMPRTRRGQSTAS
jgi:hypothetical protein